MIETRVKHYGMSVEAYKNRNLLKIEITIHEVTELVCELFSERFAKTTAAQIPVDRGNNRVI